MVGGIFNTGNRFGLEALSAAGEFFDALVGGIRSVRETLRVPGLPSAVRTCLA
jgi:hypothetical protein